MEWERKLTFILYLLFWAVLNTLSFISQQQSRKSYNLFLKIRKKLSFKKVKLLNVSIKVRVYQTPEMQIKTTISPDTSQNG